MAAAPTNTKAPLRPIASISTYNAMGRWCIKARVISKGDIRTFKNARGDGQLFKTELCDQSGEISAVFFGNAVDKFYGLLQPGRVYCFSRAAVKPANKRFDRGDFVLTYEETATIEPVDDDRDVPQVNYAAKPLDAVQNLQANEYVDVVGVVYYVQEAHTFTSKNNKQLTKREVGLWDNSGADGTCVDLTFWGEQANSWAVPEGSVLFVKGARISEWNGVKNLASPGCYEAEVNNDPRIAPLKAQFEERQRTRPLQRKASFAGGAAMRKTIEECREEDLQLAPPSAPGEPLDPNGPRTVHRHAISGTVTAVYQDRLPCYPSCPELVDSFRQGTTPGTAEKRACNKKVAEEGANVWRCASGHTCPEPVWRYIMRVKVTDHSDSMDVNLYDKEAHAMFGCEAAEYLRAWEDGKESGNEGPLKELSGRVVWHHFTLKLRAQKEIWQDEERVKHSVMEAARTDFAAEAKRMLADVNNSFAGPPQTTTTAATGGA